MSGYPGCDLLEWGHPDVDLPVDIARMSTFPDVDISLCWPIFMGSELDVVLPRYGLPRCGSIQLRTYPDVVLPGSGPTWM